MVFSWNGLFTPSLWGTLLFFAIGLALICFAGDKFVDAAVAIATRLKIPQIVVGATIVSLGTTLPEILVSTTAILGAAQSPDISFGNAIGSIICNTALIAGVGQLIRPTRDAKTGSINWRLGFFIGTILLMFGMLVFNSRTLPRWFGFILLAGFVAYAIISIKFAKPEDNKPEEITDLNGVMKIPVAILVLIVTAAGLFLGANLLVDNGQILAVEYMHVPERVVAVTMIALGTSLPELVTTLTSAIKGREDVGLGNIIGANLFNLLAVIGIPNALGGAMTASFGATFIDLPIALAVMLMLIVPMMIRKKGSRVQGAILLLGYIGYCTYSFLKI